MLRVLCGASTAPLGGCVIIAAAAGLLAPQPAAAQFVCEPSGGTATGTSTTACGAGANANGEGSTAVGAIAGLGSDNPANSFNSAFGLAAGSYVTGSNNSAFGAGAGGLGVGGSSNSAFGAGAGQYVHGNGNSAFGDLAGREVTGSGNIAIGSNAGSGVDGNPLVVSNTVAIGTGATARADGAVAIGNGAQATRQNQVVLGTADHTYTTPGITSAASRAAQTGPTQLVTSDGGGNLATATLAELGLASAGDINSINSQIAGINARLDDLGQRSNKAFAGVAMAFAMAGVPTVMPNQRFAVSMNWGTFEHQHGLALNAAVRVDNHVQFNAGIGYGTNQSVVGGRAGFVVGW